MSDMVDIRELCTNVQLNRASNWMNIDETVLTTARLKLGIENEEIILFYDSSIYGNAKTGLAICDSGVYWKDTWSSPRYLSWDTIRSINLTYDKNHIYFGQRGSFMINASGYDAKTLCDLLETIRVQDKIGNFIETTAGIVGMVKGAVDIFHTIIGGNDTSNNNEQAAITSESNQVYNNEPKVLGDPSNQVYNNEQQGVIYNNSNQVDINQQQEQIYKQENQLYNKEPINVEYVEENQFNNESLIKEIETAKGVLTDISRDLISDLINAKVNSDDELQTLISDTVMSSAALTGDKKLLSLFDKEVQQDVIGVKEQLEGDINLTENLFGLDVMSEIIKGHVSLKKSINLYNHRVTIIVENYKSKDEDNEEIYESIQVAATDFRKTLKRMIKGCNLLIEKLYMED